MIQPASIALKDKSTEFFSWHLVSKFQMFEADTVGHIVPEVQGQISHPFSLLDQSVSCVQVVWIKGHGHKRIIVLKNDMKSK